MDKQLNETLQYDIVNYLSRKDINDQI